MRGGRSTGRDHAWNPDPSPRRGVQSRGMELFVVNMTFDGYEAGEIIQADPALVADYLEAGFIARVDEHGERIIPAS